MRRTFLLALLATLFLAPFANAHGSPNPIEAEDLLLDDEATDTTAAWDGFDIQTVHVREAYLTGEHGIVVRWTLWGSVALGGAAEETVTLTFDELDAPLAWFSEDNGATWSGSGTVLEVEYTPDEDDLPFSDVQFQAFVPYTDLPVTTGESLSNAVAYAYADDTTVDVAPGGYYAHGIPQELQDPGATSERVLDVVELDGPDRYTKSNLTFADGVLTIEVENLISVSGQHIFAKTSLQPDGLADEHDDAGNHVAGGKEADAGQDVNFTIELSDFDVVQVFVETDLGGQEVFWLQGDGTISLDAPATAGAGNVDTPSIPVALVAVALAVLAAVRRR